MGFISVNTWCQTQGGYIRHSNTKVSNSSITKANKSTSASKVNYKIQVISESGKTCCITGVDNENAVLYKLPETIQGYKVVGIKTGVFENCHRIKKHYFPKYT